MKTETVTGKRKEMRALAALLAVLFILAAAKLIVRMPIPAASEVVEVIVAPAGNGHWAKHGESGAIRTALSGCLWAVPIGCGKPSGFGEHMVYAVHFRTADDSQVVYVISRGLVDIIAIEQDDGLLYWVTYPWYDRQLAALYG